jgi:penicillin G amidase
MNLKSFFLDPITGRLAKAYIYALSRSRLPQVDGQVRLKGLQGPVEVLRDGWNIPHIHALYTSDAVFAQGYTHAQERLWQMDLNRRVISGRISEVVGKAGLESDRAMRTVGLRWVAEQEALIQPDPVFSLVRAYCAGVNAWIESAIHARQLPVEFSLLGYEPEPWQPADCHSVSKLMSWILAANWKSEFMRGVLVQRLGAEKTAAMEVDSPNLWAAILDAAEAAGEQTKHLPGVIDPTRQFTGAQAADGAGSNNWVLHGTRTTSGMPMLANDMHMELSTPAIWYENHLVSDDLNVTGVSVPGAPLVIAGHNAYVAWGFTDAMSDVQDLYEEHLRLADDGQVEYEFVGVWEPAEVRHEVIQVKDSESVTEDVIVTCHGPIINVFFEKAYPDMPPLALRWTALEPESNFEAFYEMNVATSCRALYEAIRLFDGPSQNVVYADTHGEIGYALSGRIPVRANGDGSTPVPGWTGEYEWQGCIPFEELPHLTNPACGFVATANNLHSRQDEDYFIGRDYFSSARAARITELLATNPQVDLAYIQQMQYDQVSICARAMAKYLGALRTTEPELVEVVRQMQTWDGSLAPNSSLATIYEAIIRQAVGLVLDHHLGELGHQLIDKATPSGSWRHRAWEWFIDLLEKPTSPWFDLGSGEQRDDVLERALSLAMKKLKKELGPDMKKWNWGHVNQLTFRHALSVRKPLDASFNLGPYPIGGDANTIWAAFSNYLDLQSGPTAGPPYRFIADLGDIEHCWGMLAPGQSGHPASPFYGDGIQPWLKREYHPILFRWDEIAPHTRWTLKMQPA